MPRKKTNLTTNITRHVEATFKAAMQAALIQLEADLPGMIAVSLGVPTGEEALAAQVKALSGKKKPRTKRQDLPSTNNPPTPPSTFRHDPTSPN